ncbi:MAG: HAD-IC family P-type ATPase [Patescibacteria group bacterium]|nr:HAD-IC family P-type ATPase [Patescibacteria group bacterium]
MTGLTAAAVLTQREKYGLNKLPEKKGLIWPKILFSQFLSPVVYILLIVYLVSLVLGEFNDALLSGIVLLLNVAMGFYQEYKAERTFKALKGLIKPTATVIRDGKRIQVEVAELVPHDLVILSGGDRIPADGKVVEEVNLLVNEAILTGEEEPVTKNTAEEENAVFMGTSVVSGRGIMLVEKIGTKTKFGEISESLAAIKEEPTDLQQKLTKFSKTLSLIILGFCAFIFISGLASGENIWEMLRLAVILAVAAIPEGLPIAITIILALGMKKILKRKGLVKKLVSIETLGATTVICTDKTGTLTEGVMRVEKTNFKDENKALTSIIINNEQKSGMEIALWDYAKAKIKKDPYEIIENSKKIFEIPFDSQKKFHLTAAEIESQKASYLVGAPEIILEFCEIPEEEKTGELKKVETWAKEGLRVLGIAIKETGDLKKASGFALLGLVGIKDPVRKTVKDSIDIAQKAGVQIKIITGDFRLTAESVARQIGIKISNNNVLEGWEIDKLTDEELRIHVKTTKLFARVSPEHKLRIIQALQENGEIVAMTGDGVNDAPALKKSDIGMAVGEATDVAKETADLILLDSNFKTIVAAVEEGRLIFNNIKKVIAFILSNSFAEIILIFGAIVFRLPAPLTIIQILTIHLVCDGPPDIILGFDKKHKGLMEMRPEEMKREKILSTAVKFIIFSVSFVIGLSVLCVFNTLKTDLALARTISFASIASVSLIYIFSFRNLKASIFSFENFFSNPYLFLGLVYGYSIIFAAVYLPALNKALGTVPLKALDWLIVLSLGLVAIIIVETVKLIERKSTLFKKRKESLSYS